MTNGMRPALALVGFALLLSTPAVHEETQDLGVVSAANLKKASVRIEPEASTVGLAHAHMGRSCFRR